MADDSDPSRMQLPTEMPTQPLGAPTDLASAEPQPKRRFWHRLWGSSPALTTAPQQVDNTREVVETVVFVVVLVLLLKSFAAEAFVIPTGSMAETLWGYQKVVKCPECEYQFPVNASSEAEPQEGRDPTKVLDCTCPNCERKIRLASSKDDLEALQAADKDRSVILDPGWTSGDRVLVAKFLYDLFGPPNRLDVVVFKFPGDEAPDKEWPHSGPQKNNVPINYIKRLIGLSGEIVVIKGGDLYVMSAEKAKEHGLAFDDLAQFSGEEREQAKMQLWRQRFVDNKGEKHNFLHVDDPRVRAAFENPKINKDFQIVRKPPETILSMQRIVYDNDHPAKDLTNDKFKRWPGTKEWTESSGHGFTHKGADADAWNWLTYRHVLRDNAKSQDFADATEVPPQLIEDTMGYNSDRPGRHNWVGELILDCEAKIEKPEGELALELCQGVDRFRAVWNLANGRCSLFRIGADDKEVALSQQSAETKLGTGTHSLRFANVDRRLTVWVDNRVVQWSSQTGVNYDAPEDERPKTNDLTRPASIGARKGADVSVQKIRLWRDTYYTLEAPNPVDVPQGDFLDLARWTDPKMPFKTFYVQPDHYLCLGDNSPQSSDGRTWGLVPNRLLLGRAQLVYYPFYFDIWPLYSKVNRVGMIR